MRNEDSVVIVGAGMHGLAAALALSEAGGFGAIRIYTKEPIQATTSTVAAGLVEPAFVAADARVRRWFAESRARLRVMLAEPDWYVRRSAVRTLWCRDEPAPAWADLVDDFSSHPAAQPPYLREWTYSTEVVETPRHLLALARRVTARGVEIVERAVGSLLELASEARIVINCAGVGARHLGDDSVTPASGQVVILERGAQIPDQVLLVDESLTYIIPRLTDVVVGGSFVLGDWSRDPRPDVADQIMDRASRLLPQLRDARVLAHRVGLRPQRAAPRLEVEVAPPGAPGTLVAHCYGTGGAGIALAYGMAADLCWRLLRQTCGA